MSQSDTSNHSKKLLTGMFWAVSAMALLGFWFGFYLTYQMLNQCSGLQCMNVALPGLICLFSLILFLTLVRAAAGARKAPRNKKIDLLMVLVGVLVILVPVAAVWFLN